MRVGLGFDLKTKVPWTMVVAIGAVLLVALYMGLVFFQVIDSTTIFQWVVGFIFTWTFLVVFAILGGIFVGMYIATRSLSAKGLTPFEASMLQMHQQVRELTREVRQLRKAVENQAERPASPRAEEGEGEGEGEEGAADPQPEESPAEDRGRG